jgi:pilus assembly protein CpaE
MLANMQIYLLTDGAQSDELTDLTSRLSAVLPTLRKLTNLEEGKASAVPAISGDPVYIIIPIDSASERIFEISERNQAGTFYIFVSKDISASDYKRLVRRENADWVSLEGAPQEILEIIARRTVRSEPTKTDRSQLAIVAFVPSSGGVGNTTLAVETAVQLKLDKRTRARRVCLLDLDFQTGHVCDYLDIEPRLRMDEIANDPTRMDDQLFDLFVSHHSSGVDVLACRRDRHAPMEVSIEALDALFRVIALRYDLLIIDLPPVWIGWTAQVVAACDLAVVTGRNNVPSLRQVAETLDAVKGIESTPQQVVVGLNRCDTGLFGGIARRGHVKKVLEREKVLYVRDESGAATESVNTGVPVSIASRSSKISKDIQAFAALLATIAPTRVRTAS